MSQLSLRNASVLYFLFIMNCICLHLFYFSLILSFALPSYCDKDNDDNDNVAGLLHLLLFKSWYLSEMFHINEIE